MSQWKDVRWGKAVKTRRVWSIAARVLNAVEAKQARSPRSGEPRGQFEALLFHAVEGRQEIPGRQGQPVHGNQAIDLKRAKPIVISCRTNATRGRLRHSRRRL